MSIASLAPANSKKARSTAINSFSTFLAAESMTLEATHQLIDGDKTEEVGDEKKAPPCSKQDLEAMVSLLYSTAATESEYLDAALVVMMWYLYGRSSGAETVEKSQLSILPDLTSHSFRRGGAMHANDGILAENWIIERGGWQLDRVNKAFGYMLGTTQADQKVSRVLSGWKPKDGARLPTLAALDTPVLVRARKMQPLLFSSTMAFADATLNLDDDVADVLTATLFMHYPDMLVLCPSRPLITKIRELLAQRAIGESELLAWSVTINQAFVAPPASEASASAGEEQSPALIDLIKRQSEQIDVLILQNKRIDERILAVEAHLQALTNTAATQSANTDATLPAPEQPPPIGATTTRPKKKGAQSLSAIWFEWFTAEPRVYVSRSVKKTALYDEVLELGDKAQQNALTFLKSHGSYAVAAGSALKALRQMQKLGKLDALIAQFHERVDQGVIVDPTPPSALPSFIRLTPAQVLGRHHPAQDQPAGSVAAAALTGPVVAADAGPAGHHPARGQATVAVAAVFLVLLTSSAITPPERHHPARGRALAHVAALARVVALLLVLLTSSAITPPKRHHPARGPATVAVAAVFLVLLNSSAITPPEVERSPTLPPSPASSPCY
ncbi:hypothetical protein PHYSODRAFT_330408 [Phytophthora sojae]|uniref:Uncharacterized protein n=1 Tax=Phytophthora sojae (strain P6497) TaxID=1094619 RepID=G4ZAF1_PHYSP|nr:hypothetical protein PHYSODRAFT_330408 [Phytophthora sojae]EGZ22666.1 hypothetical protein PHYSODRAFT_330408 [Phytophthora sojae]|eukprot:XP_009525383.1 hypothetical protein PHYSODRAFT_330408 [Phytophthora sojae]